MYTVQFILFILTFKIPLLLKMLTFYVWVYLICVLWHTQECSSLFKFGHGMGVLISPDKVSFVSFHSVLYMPAHVCSYWEEVCIGSLTWCLAVGNLYVNLPCITDCHFMDEDQILKKTPQNVCARVLKKELAIIQGYWTFLLQLVIVTTELPSVTLMRSSTVAQEGEATAKTAGITPLGHTASCVSGTTSVDLLMTGVLIASVMK